MAITFTESAAKRIAAAVRKVERNPTDLRGEKPTHYPRGGEFLAMILDRDLSGRYSFVPVSVDAAATNPDAFVIQVGGDAFRYGFEGDVFQLAAREANGNLNVNRETIVRMSFGGYSNASDPLFIFVQPAVDMFSGLPPHDHRDNFSGGFAFAIFHPGTAVPQMPYAL